MGGYSAARFARARAVAPGLDRSLVLKHLDAGADWFSRVTGDTHGREAGFVASPLLAAASRRFLSPYLAVNATRLNRTREAVVSLYRNRLETALGQRLPEGVWERLEEAGVVAGACMLLWSKAGSAADRPAEWAWWVEGLERWAGKS